jgi:O-antigen ligase
LGLAGAYLFATMALLGITPATVGLVLAVLVFLIRFDGWRALSRDAVALIASAFGLYVSIHSLVAYFHAPTPTIAAAVAEAGPDWLKLLVFVPLAYWADARPERARRLLLLALLGFTIATLRKIDWGAFDTSFFSTRFESYLPAIAFGMFTGLGTLGLIAARDAFWGPTDQARWKRAVRVTLWGLWLLVLLQGLVLSQSRGSWIAFLAGFAALVASEWRSRAPSRGGRFRQRMAWLLVGGALALVMATQYQTFATRLSAHTDSLERLARGDIAELSADPVGLRANALAFAFETWVERPLFGWGTGTSRELIAKSGRPEALHDGDSWLPHLHNAYAETLVQLGMIGLILAIALVWALARSVASEYRSGRIPPDLYRLFLVTLVFVLIWNLFNYRVVRSDWIFFWILLAGTAYSFQLRRLREKAAATGA